MLVGPLGNCPLCKTALTASSSPGLLRQELQKALPERKGKWGGAKQRVGGGEKEASRPECPDPGAFTRKPPPLTGIHFQVNMGTGIVQANSLAHASRATFSRARLLGR